MPEEENTDVQPDSSTGESITNEAQPAVEEVQTDQDSPADQQAGVETTGPIPSPEAPLGQEMDVDEMGVPYKNRFMESQRKLDKVLEQQNALVEKIDRAQGQKRGEYSIEELEAFAETTDNTAHRTWAKGEIRKLQKEEVASGIRNEIDRWKREQNAEREKANALQTVMSRYPDAFKKDGQGQVVGWDPASPMAQRVGQYMQDPEIKDNPRGLLVAAALAYSDVAQNVTAKAAQKTTQMKSEVKNLQKKTLTEGGGVSSPPQPKTPLSSAKEKFITSGSVKDGAAAMKEILKQRGRISED